MNFNQAFRGRDLEGPTGQIVRIGAVGPVFIFVVRFVDFLDRDLGILFHHGHDECEAVEKSGVRPRRDAIHQDRVRAPRETSARTGLGFGFGLDFGLGLGFLGDDDFLEDVLLPQDLFRSGPGNGQQTRGGGRFVLELLDRGFAVAGLNAIVEGGDVAEGGDIVYLKCHLSSFLVWTRDVSQELFYLNKGIGASFIFLILHKSLKSLISRKKHFDSIYRGLQGGTRTVCFLRSVKCLELLVLSIRSCSATAILFNRTAGLGESQ